MIFRQWKTVVSFSPGVFVPEGSVTKLNTRQHRSRDQSGLEGEKEHFA